MSEAEPAAERPKPRRARWLWWSVVLLVGAVMLAEGGARFVLGLGDPPLLMAHPTIEYLAQPNQDCNRFGNRVAYNQFSMRSDDPWDPRTNPDQLRVLVVGDSIVNGGNPTDQSELATTLLQARLRAEGRPDAIVGNVSAGSWGVPNELAYLKEYGLMGADVVVLVLNRGDVDDVPTFAPLHPTMQPTTTPASAVVEGWQRYVWPKLFGRGGAKPPASAPPQQAADTTPKAEPALKELVALVRDAGARLVVVQHTARAELEGDPHPGTLRLSATVRALGVPQIGDRDALLEAAAAGKVVYRDHIHPNAEGQRALANVLADAVRLALEPPPESE